MKNRFEGYCYVCGELVEEEKGIAEQIIHNPVGPTFSNGTKKEWGVRHSECKHLTDEERKEQIREDIKSHKYIPEDEKTKLIKNL